MLHFNPRAPYGARHPWSCAKTLLSIFQSTRPIRGATAHHRGRLERSHISIHAPHTGRDNLLLRRCRGILAISIHAPHTGRDIIDRDYLGNEYKFQSTRPIRGATPSTPWAGISPMNFNPRAPYGARRKKPRRHHGPSDISIHAPHTGRDITLRNLERAHIISIHAPHTGRDSLSFSRPPWRAYFNPRAPYGARQSYKCCRRGVS